MVGDEEQQAKTLRDLEEAIKKALQKRGSIVRLAKEREEVRFFPEHLRRPPRKLSLTGVFLHFNRWKQSWPSHRVASLVLPSS